MNSENIEQILKELGSESTPPAVQKIAENLSNDFTNSLKPTRQISWRNIMNYKLTKLTAAAVIIIVVALSVTLFENSIPTAYAIEQTIEAIENVRFMHIVRRNETGQLEDERWIEIRPDGIQGRYLQDSPGRLFVVDDRHTVFAHYKDKNTVALYDPDDHWFTWIHDLGQFFKDLAGESSVTIEENVDYWGRTVHRIRWLKLNQECYIDPETKLPIAMMGYDITYEMPPSGIFDIPDVPEGVTFVDKRLGAESTEPQWMQEHDIADKKFNKAIRAMDVGEYAEAAELFAKVVEFHPGRNWAWFWFGKAQYELGKYDLAIYNFSKVIGMMGNQSYCLLARGLAYRAQGMENMACQDFAGVLPIMIDALRNTDGAIMLDYADDPLQRGRNLSAKQRLSNTIKRLRNITSQDFGYDPNLSIEENEHAIAAWEQWWSENATEYCVSKP